MSIELLWIIPVVSAALVIFTIVLGVQSRRVRNNGIDTLRDLKEEVDAFNSGLAVVLKKPLVSAEQRLSKIESTIQLVSTALSNQQKIIENFHGKDDTLEKELNILKEKLKELQNEYDITISENYSLRACFNSVENEKARIKGTAECAAKNDVSMDTDAIEIGKVLNMKIYDEERRLDLSKPSTLEDTSEFNISTISN